MKKMIRRALESPEQYVVELKYCDSKGQTTKRIVSPIRIVAAKRLLALCLCREEPRQFYLDRCSDVRLLPAHEVLMPATIG